MFYKVVVFAYLITIISTEPNCKTDPNATLQTIQTQCFTTPCDPIKKCVCNRGTVFNDEAKMCLYVGPDCTRDKNAHVLELEVFCKKSPCNPVRRCVCKENRVFDEVTGKCN